jgi:hypothetical protein
MQRVPPEIARSKESIVLEKALMRALLQRDRANAELDMLKRKTLMHTKDAQSVPLKLSTFIDRLVHERNHLEERLIEAQKVIDTYARIKK